MAQEGVSERERERPGLHLTESEAALLKCMVDIINV